MEKQHKYDIIQEIAEEDQEKVETQFKIGRNVKDPFDRLQFCSDFEMKDDLYLERFVQQYGKVDKRNLVWIENFREDTRQWRMTYDPFQNQKLLQTYGKQPPKSFIIRQKILEEQRNILDRYSQITPVNDQDFVLNKIKQDFKNQRRDYYVQKRFNEHQKIKALNELLWSNIERDEEFGPPQVAFEDQEWNDLAELRAVHEEAIEAAGYNRD